MYRLICDDDLQTIWDSLPDEASRQLTAALSDVCHEPYIETEPWGIDDGTHRLLIRSLITVRLAVNDTAQTIRIYSIEYLG